MTVHPDYVSFLGTLDSQGPLSGDAERWRVLLLDSHDLLMATMSDDVGQAKTTIAGITKRIWPKSSEIPARVRTSLGVLRVQVRW